MWRRIHACRQVEELHLVQQDEVIGSEEAKQGSQLRDRTELDPRVN
jgi:hypothetical protein